MKAHYRIGNPNDGGIYQIRNLVNGMLYLGSAKKYRARYTQHLSYLRRGKHCNKRLQRAYDKYGPDNFVFEPICVVMGDIHERTDKEQEYLDCYEAHWDKIYNHARTAIVNEGFTWSSESTEKRCKTYVPWFMADINRRKDGALRAPNQRKNTCSLIQMVKKCEPLT